MANEIRLRSNNQSGAITDNPLTNISTTINSPGFVDLPVLNTTNHLMLIMDPLELNGPAEIIQVTAHTAAATSVTVIRGAEGSAARTHVLGTTWFHGPVVSDYNYTQRTALSTNRPTSPFTGELIYETDTKKFVAFDGTNWVYRDGGSVLGFVTSTTTQAGVGAEVDITGLTFTVTTQANRRYKLTCRTDVVGSAAGVFTYILLKQDGAEIGRWAGITPSGNETTPLAMVVFAPAAGSHVFKATI